MTDFQAIASDLELCDLGIALTKGKRRKAFQQQCRTMKSVTHWMPMNCLRVSMNRKTKNNGE